jgi:hypothetical protein
MGSDAVLVGEIAHIEGALPDSARFNGRWSQVDSGMPAIQLTKPTPERPPVPRSVRP